MNSEEKSQSDLLILVNENDEEIGFETKQKCHDQDGILHRAFSILILFSRSMSKKPPQRLSADIW